MYGARRSPVGDIAGAIHQNAEGMSYIYVGVCVFGHAEMSVISSPGRTCCYTHTHIYTHPHTK